MNFGELYKQYSATTRIAVISANQQILSLLETVALKNGISLLIAGNRQNEADFVAVSSELSSDAADFRPTIAYLSEDSEVSESFLESITAGGILIYPENKNLPETCNYFRKLPYKTAFFTKKNNSCEVETEMGMVEVKGLSDSNVQELHGLLMLCQQVGLQEEEFYDALFSFPILNE